MAVESLGGERIWEKDFAPAGEADAEQTVTVDWNEIVGAQKNGVVLFTAESTEPRAVGGKRVGTQTLIQLTDLGAVWKQDRDHTSLHLFSLATGKGLPALRLQLLDPNGKSLAEAVTDAAGNAQLPQDDEMRWVFARSADDAQLIALNGDGLLPLYRLGVTQEDADGDGNAANTVFMFTERGVYKPGDKVYLKGFARDSRHEQPAIPAGKTITLKLYDAKDREILNQEIMLSDYGSFEQEITLPDAPLGKYRLTATSEKEDRLGGSCYFQVQEYKPNAFEIMIPAPPDTIGDTQLALPITAKYFMGKPLSKARLSWSLVARDSGFTPDEFIDFVFCNGIYDFRLNRPLDRLSQYNAQGQLAVDAEGRAQVTTPLPLNSKAPQPRSAKLICEVTDINQQTVSNSRAFVQQASEFYLGVKRFDSVVAEGQPLPIELIALKPDGKPLDRPVPATIRLSRIKWQTNRLATAGGTSDFESKPALEKLWERELPTQPGLADNRKPAIAHLEKTVADKPGEYLLEATAKDGSGHDVLTAMVFEVSGEAQTDWNYRNPYVIDLVPDKDSYEPGQTARILVKTPIAGDALVTVERDRVLRSFIVPLTGNAPAVGVPIQESDAPNVFVSVMILRGAKESPRKIKTPEYRIGYASLKVAQPKAKLAVSVQPKNRSARPGEMVQLEAEVKDSTGKPAANAELTLSAVDEGVLSLTAYETPDPLAFFNQPRGLGVSTSLTLPTLLREDAPEADFANKGYLIGDGKGGAPLLDGLRTNFVATPFWNGTLHTDAQGRAHAEFKAPDSLTRYRVVALAATKENQFGDGESAFEINKPIMIESAMPAFANVGDKIVLRAVVHNTTDIGGKADVLFEIDDRVRAAERTRQIDLAPHQSVAVDLPIEVLATGASKWKWGVRFVPADGSAPLGDAVEAKIKLNYPAPLIRQVETKRIDTASAELLRITDPQIAEGSGEVTVSLTNTRVGELRESLRQLLHYPYGCVEQTASSMLPWLTVSDLRKTLPELAKSDEEIAKVLDNGIQRLFSMQTSGGGLSYWPHGNEPMLWGSAYGGLALALAKKGRLHRSRSRLQTVAEISERSTPRHRG
ncbi:MAG: alpha-2-macroglobulin family protein [Chthoniobacterales bacterium]